jgi:hypothetical protein
VQAEGYQTESSDHELKGTEVRPFLAALHGAGVVRGRVLSAADGEPLAGAGVEIVHPKFQRSAKTNDRGEFEFNRLPPGEVEVKAAVPGFQEAALNAVADEQSGSVEFSLIGEAGLTGIVTDATLKKPIPGAVVRIAGTDLSTKTADDGSYQLSNIPGRKATVQVVGRGYRQQDFTEDFAAQKEAKLNVELKGGTILSGIVQDALSKTPLPDAEVELAGTSQKTRTDEAGRFRFEDLPAGSKSLKIAAAGYLPAEEETELKRIRNPIWKSDSKAMRSSAAPWLGRRRENRSPASKSNWRASRGKPRPTRTANSAWKTCPAASGNWRSRTPGIFPRGSRGIWIPRTKPTWISTWPGRRRFQAS